MRGTQNETFTLAICFTICLFIRQDLVGTGMFHREPKDDLVSRLFEIDVGSRGRGYVSRYVCSLVRTETGTGHPK